MREPDSRQIAAPANDMRVVCREDYAVLSGTEADATVLADDPSLLTGALAAGGAVAIGIGVALGTQGSKSSTPVVTVSAQ